MTPIYRAHQSGSDTSMEGIVVEVVDVDGAGLARGLKLMAMGRAMRTGASSELVGAISPF